MKLSILTTISNPDARQDKWAEALECYKEFADEVVIVDGGDEVVSFDNGFFKVVPLKWEQEWNWIELPKHLNAGLEECIGDWILKLDIDQFVHEDDFEKIRLQLEFIPEECDVATFQKMTMLYGGKYYQKGGQEIAFRNKKNIMIGKNKFVETDLCFPIYFEYFEEVDGYNLPVGQPLNRFKTGISYWNYDYFFKTQEFTRKEFWRFSRAYERYFKTWHFGGSEEDAFNIFLTNMKHRHDTAPYTAELKDHSKYIRESVKNLTPEQFGYNGWGLCK